MSKHVITQIIDKKSLLPDIIKFTIKSPEIARNSVPGQFLEIKCSDGLDILLRRPISISNVDKVKNKVEFILQVRGKATQLLIKKQIGEELDLLGPLGKGFSTSQDFKRVAVIGGGIGIFPLLFLANQYSKTQVSSYFGFRNKELVILEKEFNEVSNELRIATDDGSYGYGGLVTDLFLKDLESNQFDMIYACGPLPMLRKVKEIALDAKISCEISVEERMGCGVGAFLGCAVKLIDGDDWRYGHVCKDGPVFRAEDIILE